MNCTGTSELNFTGRPGEKDSHRFPTIVGPTRRGTSAIRPPFSSRVYDAWWCVLLSSIIRCTRFSHCDADQPSLCGVRVIPVAVEILENSNWKGHEEDLLSDALAELDERSLDIVNSRWLAEKKATLHELAERYNVSAERIRQLEKNALKKLKDAVVLAA